MKKFIFGITLTTAFAFAADETKEFDSEGLKSIDFENTSGELRVSVSSDAKTSVQASKINFPKSCTLAIDERGGELIVKVQEKGVFNRESCRVDFEIKVPKNLDLDLKLGAGNIFVNNTQGKLIFKVGTGEVKVDAHVKQLEGVLGSGFIEAIGLIGNAKIKTGSGNIVLSYKSVPQKGTLNIKTGNGDATVSFPANSKILSDFQAGVGKTYNELGDSPSADFKVSMRAGRGDLKIKKQ